MAKSQEPTAGMPGDGDVPDRFVVDFTGRTLLGIYNVVEKIADGGMGSVYLGEDTNLGRKVVIKVPHVRWLSERGFRGRFAREITELVRLEHPSIVRILAQGQEDEVPFFVLQFLGGGSLETRLDGPCTAEDVLDWLPTIAKTLDYVHANGTIHRDVKPGNVLFDHEGHVFLSDFGVAKALEEEDLNLTEAGTGVGSPNYMAPEQGFGKQITGAADQYALGSMAYEALAGRPPFVEGSALELLMKKNSADAQPLRELAPALPQDAAAAVHKAMARDPAHRFASCTAFAKAFAGAVKPELEITGSHAVPRQRRWGIAAMIAVIVAVVAAWQFWGGTDQDGGGGSSGALSEEVVRIKLLDPGAEPRRRLRYAFTAPSRETFKIVQSEFMKMTQGETTFMEGHKPHLQQEFEIVIDRVDDKGNAHMHWTLRDAQLENHEGVKPQHLESMKLHIPAYESFHGKSIVMPRGVTVSFEPEWAKGLTREAEQEVQMLVLIMRSLATPLPQEPVGIGARWEVTEVTTIVGMSTTQASTFELVGMDGDEVDVRLHIAQTAPRQTLKMPGIPPEAGETTLHTLHGTGSGRSKIDLRRLAASLFEIQVHIDMKMTMAGMPVPEKPMENVVDFHIDYGLKSLAR